MSPTDDSLDDLQAEGRQKLRERRRDYEREQQEIAESREKAKQRRRDLASKFWAALGSIVVQALGTLLGGGLLALAGLASGVIRTTPRGQIASAVVLIVSLLTGLSGAILTGILSNRSLQAGERTALEVAYLLDVARINEKYRMSEETTHNDAEPPA